MLSSFSLSTRFCSIGAADSARIIIAEVNRQMPRTLGDSFIHVSRLSAIVETDYPLPEAVQGKSTAEYLRIGQIIADMIPDGATLQMGVACLLYTSDAADE